MEPRSSERRIANAAMDLVDAVSSSVQSAQLNLQYETNQHLADAKKTLESLQTATGSNCNNQALLKAVEDLKNETVAAREEGRALRDFLAHMDKARRIEFALQNLSLVNDFKYSSATEITDPYNSDGKAYSVSSGENGKHLIRDILLWFRKGHGLFVTNNFLQSGPPYLSTVKEINPLWKQAFEDKLSDELHFVLGQKPRFEHTKDGRVSIHYE